MTDGHHTRQHAKWSASATSRNIQCAGAIAMSSLCEDVEREAAAWGTCAHEISEQVLRVMTDPAENREICAHDFIGSVKKIGKFEFTVGEEMANTAQTYIDYCLERIDAYHEETGDAPLVEIEKKLSLDKLDPPLQAGGTGDFLIWFPKWKLLEVCDLKGGRGVTVDVVGNPQGRSYAIGAVLSLSDVKPTHVRVTIVQPRVGDGKPKSETFHVADLMDWTTDLLGHMARAKQALDEFNALPPGNRLAFDEWAEAWLSPGQCTFCTAKPICPALRRQALAAMPELARKWHEDVSLTTLPVLSNTAKLGSPEELAHDLDGFDELEGWIKARRAYAHNQAEAGVSLPGYGLVDKIGFRTWLEKDQNNLCCAIQEALNLKGNEILEPGSVKSVAQIEKALGKRKAELAKLEGKLWEKPVKGTNLVRLDKTTRPAAKSVAERFNETVE